jgi:hypothetical protein
MTKRNEKRNYKLNRDHMKILCEGSWKFPSVTTTTSMNYPLFVPSIEQKAHITHAERMGEICGYFGLIRKQR